MAGTNHVATTDRLRISKLSFADAKFILKLLNEPDFIRFIGDRRVRTEQDARMYLQDGPLTSYSRHGFGLYKVASKTNQHPLGICGLVKRDELELPDLGFAFSEVHWGNGYAFEACQAVLRHAATKLMLSRLAAIVNPDNGASLRLLDKLGFDFETKVRMRGESKGICQYSITLTSGCL